ncbi:hypothetical protein BASA81_000871 [Batrachochytrium salamandrivorans]|nr:hypothetical protein BASA81_000871 [Batrachochytrium salamandrivorans]
MRSLLKRADLLQPRVEEDAKQKTSRNGCLFLFAYLASILLAYNSIATYLSPNQVLFSERMEVDTEMSAKLPVELGITFFHLSCVDVELVVLDVAGEAQINIDAKSLHKTRIDAEGRFLGEKIAGQVNRPAKRIAAAATATNQSSLCGSCFGAEEFEGDCCPTCLDVKSRYQKRGWDISHIQREAQQCVSELDHPEIAVQPGEGCILEGVIYVNKVAGNIHVALGSTQRMGDQIVHVFAQDQIDLFDTSHTISKLRFGSPVLSSQVPHVPLPGGVLDSTTKRVDFSLGRTAAIQYHLHLVPSRIKGMGTSYKYSLTERYFPVADPNPASAPLVPNKKQRQFTLPGVYFMYDFSPFVVVREPVRVQAIDVLADLLTLSGGTFALASALDKLLLGLFKI